MRRKFLSAPSKKRSMLLLGVLVFAAIALQSAGGPARASADCSDQGANDLYVDVNSLCGACSDAYTKAQNNVTHPWCTIMRSHTGSAAEKITAGQTLYIQDGHYNENIETTISGTAGNPITYKALSTGAYISPATNVVDENFVLVGGTTNVYSIALASAPSVVRQTHFTDIVVDDPGNDSYYTLTETDGPINLTNDQITGTADVDTAEGSWWWSGGTLYVHRYGHGAPTTANSDLWAPRNALAFQINANYNIVDGLKFYYAETSSGIIYITANKHDNIIRNVYSANGGVQIHGYDNRIENVRSTHGHARKKDDGSEGGGLWSWTKNSGGSGGGDDGSGNVYVNSEFFHNWNNFSTQTNATGLVMDGVEIHGSPNHCLLTQGVNLTFRNMRVYNCQDDYLYAVGVDGATYENGTSFELPGFQENVGTTLRNITYRNNIFHGCNIAFVYANSCAWEDSMTFTNNMFFCNPGETITVEHCTAAPASGTVYDLDDYQTLCGNGTLTGCMEFSNNIVVTSNFSSVIAGGRWTGDLSSSDAWDIHIPNISSAAHDAGINTSGATTDYEGDDRPLGSGFDIGADEFDENAAPILAAIGNQTIHEGDNLVLNLSASDLDGDDLDFSVTGNPSGSSLVDHGDGTATFSWTPTTSQSGTYANIQFSVTDGTATDTETITITVQDGLSGCTPSWWCTDWTICSSSLQSRSCTDNNECGTDAGKPAQSQACDSTPPGTITDLRVQ